MPNAFEPVSPMRAMTAHRSSQMRKLHGHEHMHESVKAPRPASPTAHFAQLNPSDGRSDDIHAHVAPGSFVMPADVVSAIGRGSSSAGHEVLNHAFKPHMGAALGSHPAGLGSPITSGPVGAPTGAPGGGSPPAFADGGNAFSPPHPQPQFTAAGMQQGGGMPPGMGMAGAGPGASPPRQPISGQPNFGNMARPQQPAPGQPGIGQSAFGGAQPQMQHQLQHPGAQSAFSMPGAQPPGIGGQPVTNPGHALPSQGGAFQRPAGMAPHHPAASPAAGFADGGNPGLGMQSAANASNNGGINNTLAGQPTAFGPQSTPLAVNLSRDEYVVPPSSVASIGNGSVAQGGQILQDKVNQIRQGAGSNGLVNPNQQGSAGIAPRFQHQAAGYANQLRSIAGQL